jgi:hypothetical protein
MWIELKNDIYMEFVDRPQIRKFITSTVFRPIDFVVFENYGNQNDGKKNFESDVYSLHGQNTPKIILLPRWLSQFPLSGGEYDPKKLEILRRSGTSLSCSADGSKLAENRIIADLLSLNESVDGIIWLDGLNNLGNAKVGEGSGPYGDCLHFCMPGPADEVARALYWLILGITGTMASSTETRFHINKEIKETAVPFKYDEMMFYNVVLATSSITILFAIIILDRLRKVLRLYLCQRN